MRIGTHGLRPIRPARPPDSLTARSNAGAGETRAEPDGGEARTGTAVAKHPQPHEHRHPLRLAISNPLVVQILAQKLPGKSDRRLARYFPERALGAYQKAAAGPLNSGPHAQKTI